MLSVRGLDEDVFAFKVLAAPLSLVGLAERLRVVVDGHVIRQLARRVQIELYGRREGFGLGARRG